MWGTLDIIFYFGLCWPQLAGYIATGQWLAEACDAIVDRTGFFSELCICWTRPIGAVLLFPTLSHGLGRRAGGELALSLSLSLVCYLTFSVQSNVALQARAISLPVDFLKAAGIASSTNLPFVKSLFLGSCSILPYGDPFQFSLYSHIPLGFFCRWVDSSRIMNSVSTLEANLCLWLHYRLLN